MISEQSGHRVSRSCAAAIVGGGPAGIAAAISAKRNGADILICEKMPRLGKKLLATGGGRCNLSNRAIDSSFYNESARAIAAAVFKRFGGEKINNFFEELGLKLYDEDGRVFPITNQASSVLKVLEIELARLSIPVELNFDVMDISCRQNHFIIRSRGNRVVECGSVILASGGKTLPASGSDGSSYNLAKPFGHSIIEPAPSAVPLMVKKRLCHLLQGQRIRAGVKAVIDGRVVSEAQGELLFTKYGLSGTAVLDISEEISIAINRDGKRDVCVVCDLVPFMGLGELKDELRRRLKRGIPIVDMLSGLLPDKFGAAFGNILAGGDPAKIARELKGRRFQVSATRGWNEAEFTAGGVDIKDVNEDTLESKLKKGLYFAGEVLDVDGKRGGYNLAWAWASGMAAGLLGTVPDLSAEALAKAEGGCP